ncbi:hypothetical protein GCM10022291_22600 [Postechiella marina]|uniref:LVIVD repeat-containing protein n=1 Tax=Postechiella marina TaxID=943941 RepID=A0ABP8CB96_9FLAO
MKTKCFFVCFLLALLSSCNNDDANFETVTVAIPEVLSMSEFRKSVSVKDPQIIEELGKIYAYENYIFVSDVAHGIHVIDNTNPESPQAIKFINIPRNEDISIKDNFLYADSASDLVVFDISDINNIIIKERLENVFVEHSLQRPAEADFIDWGSVDYKSDMVVVGWTLKEERRTIDKNSYVDNFTIEAASADSRASDNVGTGGSLARFQIVKNYLYTVSSHEMTIFNISDLTKPTQTSTFYAGNNIETLFYAENYLYIGSTDGMYIYDLKNAEAPEYVSEFIHWTGCDPVVVDGNYAYLTLRGGNNCGQQDSVLEIIDISDKANPTLAARHILENPYGLGVKGNRLFVCDGNAGLKVFNKENPLDIKQIGQFKNIQSKDVIPLKNTLVMIGGNSLYQYEYTDNGVAHLSTFSLN